jgi:hypothetical protein
MLLSLTAERKFVDRVDRVAQRVAGLELVRISPKISPILYSIVSALVARPLNPSR